MHFFENTFSRIVHSCRIISFFHFPWMSSGHITVLCSRLPRARNVCPFPRILSGFLSSLSGQSDCPLQPVTLKKFAYVIFLLYLCTRFGCIRRNEAMKNLLQTIERYRALGIDQQIDYKKFYLYSIITNSTALSLDDNGKQYENYFPDLTPDQIVPNKMLSHPWRKTGSQRSVSVDIMKETDKWNNLGWRSYSCKV